MAQQFQADANVNTTVQTLTNGAAILTVTGNFMNPPFGNCKAKILGASIMTLGSVPTNVTVAIFRNPSGENVQVATSGAITMGSGANAVVQYSLAAVDRIPDGRSVQYALSITAAGTGTNGTSSYSYIEATLLSG